MRGILTQAARLMAPRGDVVISACSVPRPADGEVLLRMEACGLCRLDLFVSGLPRLPAAPLTLGHEGVGVIEAKGPGVGLFRLGQRVATTFLASTCGSCDFCRTGSERFCARQDNLGYTRDGTLSGFAAVPAQSLVVVPDEVPSRLAAPLGCAGWSAYAAIRQAALEPGQTVAIFGVGGLGHLALQYAQHRGLRVAACDTSERRLALARTLGADIVLPTERAGRALLKQHGGADAAVIFTNSPAAVREALTSLRRTGTLVMAAISTENYELPVIDTIFKGVTIRGSYLGSRRDLEEVFALAASGVGIPRVDTYPLAQVPKLMDRMRRGQMLGRAVVVF